jgi:hypothetical protein
VTILNIFPIVRLTVTLHYHTLSQSQYSRTITCYNTVSIQTHNISRDHTQQFSHRSINCHCTPSHTVTVQLYNNVLHYTVNTYSQYKTPTIHKMAFPELWNRLYRIMSDWSKVLHWLYLQFKLKLYQCTELGLTCEDERGYVTTHLVFSFYFYFVTKLNLYEFNL